MRRSRLGPKSYEAALERRMALQQRKKEKGCQKPRRPGISRARRQSVKRKPIRRAGKKVKAWESERRKLKKRFQAVGITTCELQYEGCANDDYLGFAHAAKRRKLAAEDLKHAILCCNFCHDQIEVLSPEKMKQIVDETTQSRKVQP